MAVTAVFSFALIVDERLPQLLRRQQRRRQRSIVEFVIGFGCGAGRFVSLCLFFIVVVVTVVIGRRFDFRLGH